MINLPLLLPLAIVFCGSLHPIPAALVCLSVWLFHFMYTTNRIFLGRFFHFLCVTLLVVIVLFFSSQKLLSFYILFELSLVPTVLIVFFFGYQPEKILASTYLLLYTVVASLPLLLVVISRLGTLTFLEVNSFLGVFCVTFAFMVKTPIYLVHVWLPKAHVEAPVAGSMVLAGLLLKLGSFGLLVLCPKFTRCLLLVYLSLSVWGSIFCRLGCLRQ